MALKKREQKFISFADNGAEFERIQNEISGEWCVISLVAHNGRYVGIMEKTQKFADGGMQKVYIPPRKKIRIK